ncbi:MAG: cupin domain-containing protein [Parvibaculaceae bacterium]|nr:cupin domain-containing protein [Parvibaculaceae bacterium]
MKASLADLLSQLPGPVTAEWPGGEPFAGAMSHGSMSVEVFAPRGEDRQGPHEQDELYFIVTGRADFEHEGRRRAVIPGDVLFVPAGDPHRFHAMSDDFATWVVFWGPEGGEKASQG